MTTPRPGRLFVPLAPSKPRRRSPPKQTPSQAAEAPTPRPAAYPRHLAGDGQAMTVERILTELAGEAHQEQP